MANLISGITVLSARLDWGKGTILIDSQPVIFEKKFSISAIENLCSAPTQQENFRIRYKFLQKVNIFGNLADGVIEFEKDRSVSFTFLFDLVEFFDLSILESRIIKKCQSFWNTKFMSNHPSSASLDSCDWGEVMFFYDAKQGDLSLQIKFYPQI